MMPIDDSELMLRAGKGNRQAFEEIYRRYFKGVLNFFWRLSWNVSESEEWAQEVFLRLWRNRKDYKATGKFSTYLFQIAKNYWINEVRKEAKAPKIVSVTVGEEEESGERDIPVEQENPHEQVDAKEVVEKVKEAVDALPETYKIPFILSRYHGFRYNEIAKILEVAPRTVEWRVAEAFRILETKLGRLLEG